MITRRLPQMDEQQQKTKSDVYYKYTLWLKKRPRPL